MVALVVALQPLLTGALSGKVTGEATPLHRWIGMGIGLAGVAPAGLFIAGTGVALAQHEH
ncbi:MAG TPA: hypothetical protein VJ904_06050 [Tichowtungia sp.]|nr:hypothetical protein [Tichowtungia sp.]